MNRPCSKNRFGITLKLLLLASLAPPCLAAELVLRPFSASYDLYQGGMHIAVTSLSLQRSGEQWRWTSHTAARGIFSWFTSKQPYTETTFTHSDNEIQLNEILIADVSRIETQVSTNIIDILSCFNSCLSHFFS